MRNNKTPMLRKEELKRSWIILDASGKTLGRFASEVAKILRGKHRPDFTPNVDCGAGVIVVNAEKIRVTGAKEAQKIYHYYTGHIGGMREIPYRVMLEKKPDYIIEHAVWGMMPKGRLSKAQMRHLRIMRGNDHKMTAQQPATPSI